MRLSEASVTLTRENLGLSLGDKYAPKEGNMVTKNENGFRRGDPVMLEISGMRYVGVFQEHSGLDNAQVLVLRQGERPTNLPMLVGMSSLCRQEGVNT